MKKQLNVYLKESTDNTVGGLNGRSSIISFCILSNNDIIWTDEAYFYINNHAYVEISPQVYKEYIQSKEDRFRGVSGDEAKGLRTHTNMKRLANQLDPSLARTKRVLDGRFWVKQSGKETYDILAFRGKYDNVMRYHNIWFPFIENYQENQEVWLDIPKWKEGKKRMTWDQLKNIKHQSNPEADIRQSMRDRIHQAAGIGEAFSRDIKPTELQDIETAGELGGTHPIKRGRTASGENKIIKPHDEKFRAGSDYAGAKIGRHMYPDYPDVEVRKHGNLNASEQEYLDADAQKLGEPSSLSQEDLKHIVQDSVLNGLIGNHDAHRKQFVRRRKDKRLIGIDKTQAFKKYDKGRLSLNYHPNADGGEDRPYIYYVLEAWKRGEVKIDPQWFHEAIQKLQSIPEEQFISYIRPYAESVSDHFGGSPEDIIRMALHRKKNLGVDYSNFLSAVMDRPIVFENRVVQEGKQSEIAYGTNKGVPKEVVEYVLSKDPSGTGKYTSGMIRRAYINDLDGNMFFDKAKDYGVYKKDPNSKPLVEYAFDFAFPIDHGVSLGLTVQSQARRFHHFSQMHLIPKEYSDYNDKRFDDKQFFEKFLVDIDRKGRARIDRKVINTAKKYKYNGGLIIPIHTHEQVCKYGKHTKGCVTEADPRSGKKEVTSKNLFFFIIIPQANNKYKLDKDLKFAVLVNKNEGTVRSLGNDRDEKMYPGFIKNGGLGDFDGKSAMTK